MYKKIRYEYFTYISYIVYVCSFLGMNYMTVIYSSYTQSQHIFVMRELQLVGKTQPTIGSRSRGGRLRAVAKAGPIEASREQRRMQWKPRCPGNSHLRAPAGAISPRYAGQTWPPRNVFVGQLLG